MLIIHLVHTDSSGFSHTGLSAKAVADQQPDTEERSNACLLNLNVARGETVIYTDGICVYTMFAPPWCDIQHNQQSVGWWKSALNQERSQRAGRPDAAASSCPTEFHLCPEGGCTHTHTQRKTKYWFSTWYIWVKEKKKEKIGYRTISTKTIRFKSSFFPPTSNVKCTACTQNAWCWCCSCMLNV